ncbi:hypothetical protein Pmar_PMAR004224 [Perkinsus marinus ATCC 50983]|uniref:Tyr recombinase domain-containing protein n=1 Tax=Perkinsus marinus (strain ATCC 50983 / TXsc) TaxID=423536 RepID=C5LPN1_PERM5|nr:hypothetical protein Pmar_PMAR004224 [Perkinsus marinus ATCC 50983]EER01351.1 hypothetical protein Pmar_PMAR004224 [Perkinsus marinus ATCC 50983]|eukprot:XP_002768633.1 hypothetical protein Pmar_PMAR004224 [Perkinsus marinus ATCC 50983]
MTKAGYAFSTITKYCSQVRNAARLNNTLRLNDADQATIQLAMRSAERQLGSATARALTLSKEQVLQVATELDRVRVDFADGFLVGTMGLLRVAEMLYIRAQDVDPFATTADGIPVCGATLKITRSKCDQGAKGVWRPLPCTSSPRVNLPTVCSSRFCAAHLLLRRAAAANNMTDRLFPFSNSAFSAHLRSAMATVIGQPNESVRLSSHTMRRSGSAICCDAPNFSVPLVAEFGRWSTADTLQNVYLRDNAHAFNRFVSGLLVAWGS